MAPTRRDFLKTSLAAAAGIALPVGHVASAVAPVATSEPISIAPGVDVIDASARWNTVERTPVDLDDAPRAEMSWHGHGWLFVNEHRTNRATQRRIDLLVYADGSMRIGISSVDSFDTLTIGRGHVGIHLAPDLSNEVWRGLFAQTDDDSLPCEPFQPQPWDHDSYIKGQRRIHRMQNFAKLERQTEAPDAAVVRWFNREEQEAA